MRRVITAAGETMPASQSMPASQTLTLPYVKSTLRLEFALPRFGSPESIRYQYRLAGLDDAWSGWTDETWREFTSLPESDYRFEVRARDEQLRVTAATVLDFRVLPPWYRTWWAVTLYAVSLIAVVSGIVRLRVSQLRKRVAAREQTLTERELLVSELELKNAELERFTYTVSHDLKSPLITIKGFLGILAKDDNQDPARKEHVIDRIGNAADTMSRLLDELLALSRIGRITNPSQLVPLGPLVVEVIEQLKPRISEYHIEVVVAQDLPTVSGDRVRLREVYQNLIENAVRFRGDEPAPRIEIGWVADGPQLFVRDNGIGIEPEYHDRIFGLFEQLNPSPKTGGTGIGLAIVKRIIEVRDGNIRVESEGPGHGTTVWFTFGEQVNAVTERTG